MPPESYLDAAGQVLAVLVRPEVAPPKVQFFTPPDWPLQVGRICYPAGHAIRPHRHNPVPRSGAGTMEVLYVQAGHLALLLWDGTALRHRVSVAAGSLIILPLGSTHGFEILEPTVLLECKNGPYTDQATDKTFLE